MVTFPMGDGRQTFQPIHADDLAATVAQCLEKAAPVRRTLEPVGPETLTVRDMIALTRQWLDLPPSREIQVPMGLIRLLARVGDLVGAGPIATTSLRQMEYGNTGDPAAFQAATGLCPSSMAQAFRDAPSHVQDRWHARLYFLAPILGIALALLWLGSGIAGLLYPPADTDTILGAMGVPHTLTPWVARGCDGARCNSRSWPGTRWV